MSQVKREYIDLKSQEKDNTQLREVEMIQFMVANYTVIIVGVILLVVFTKIIFFHDCASFEKYFRIRTSK